MRVERAESIRRLARLRRMLHALRYTPFHPQFLAYRHERRRYRTVGGQCSGRVLDIGSGRQPLREHLGDGCDYVSLDYPSTASWYGVAPSVYADAARLPFPDGTFDTVACLEVLEHLPDPTLALREAGRVVKPTGTVFVSTPFLYPVHDAPADYQRWTPYGLQRLAQACGLGITSFQSLGTPLESGALLWNLSLAWEAMEAGLPGRVFRAALAAVTIPLANLLALLSALGGREFIESPCSIGYLVAMRPRAPDM